MKVTRILCIVMIFVQLFSVVTFAEVDSSLTLTETEMQKLNATVDKLERLDVLPDNFSFDADRYVTRAEFADIILKMRNIDSTAHSDGVQYFNDVGTDHKYFDSINVAYLLGYVSRGDDAMFEPDSYITYQQMYKMLIVLLGYEDLAKEYGGYPYGYGVIAGNLKLIKNNVSEADNVRASKMLEILETAIHVDVAIKDDHSTNGVEFKTYKTVKGKNLLAVYHNIYNDKGIVQTVGFNSIFGEGNRKSNYVSISDKAYEGDSDYLINYLGCNVEFYYTDFEDDTAREIVYVKDHGSNILIIDAENIDTFEHKTYYYYNADTSRSLSKAPVVTAPYVLYNGRIATDNRDDMYVPEMGRVKLVDNDLNGLYDVLIIEAYENYVVEAVDIQNQVVYDKFDSEKILQLENSDSSCDRKLFTENGKEMYLTTLNEWAVITALVSQDGKYVRGTVYNKSASGVIEKIIYDNDGKVDILKIGTQDLKIAESYKIKSELDKIENGLNVICYLDYAGNIAAVKIITGDEFFYGFIMTQPSRRGRLNEICEVYMLTSGDEKIVYPLAKKTYIDKKPYNSAKEQCSTLASRINDTPVVRYKLNEANEITEFDTIYMSDKEKENLDNALDTYLERTEKLLYKTSGNVEDKLFITADTNIFVNYTSATDIEEKYSALNMSRLSNDTRYTVSAYNVGKTFNPQVVVIEMSGASGTVSNDPLYLVENVHETVINEDEYYTEYSLYDGNTRSRLLVEPDISSNLDIGIGDVIRCDIVRDIYLLNDYIVKVYDYDDKELLHGYKDESGKIIATTAKCAIRYGFVYDKIGSYYSLAIADKIEEVDEQNTIVSTMPATIFKYSIKRGKVITESASTKDLKQYVTYSDKASNVIVRYRYRVPYQLIIIE